MTDDEIKNKFYETASRQYVIQDIEDVSNDNQHLYEMQLWKKCNELWRVETVEKLLWHGSSYDILNKIIRNGFDRSYSTIAVYGKGRISWEMRVIVVVQDISTHSDGYKYLLLCKVIVGDSADWVNACSSIEANGNEYDTLVDSPQNPSIYVVWRDFAAVPMCRIKLKQQ